MSNKAHVRTTKRTHGGWNLGRYLVKVNMCVLADASLQVHVDYEWADDFPGRKSATGSSDQTRHTLVEPRVVFANACWAAHSLWIPDRVASGALLGSSALCFGSVSRKPGSTGDKAALARSVSSGACLLTAHVFAPDFPFSICVK